VAQVVLRGATKRFADTSADDQLDLAAEDGEVLVLPGPSGCGKTTAVLGTVEAVRPSGKYPNVQRGVAPFPVNYPSVKVGIDVGGSGLNISNQSSAARASIQALSSSMPGDKVAYEQLLAGIDTTATDGAVRGPYAQMHTAELNTEESVFHGGCRAVHRSGDSADKDRPDPHPVQPAHRLVSCPPARLAASASQ